MKKKILSVIVCAAAILSLTACAKNEDPFAGLTTSQGTSSTPNGTSSKPSSKPVSSATQSSNTPANSSAPEESKPEESSVPENKNEIDWDSVPYADELDFMTEDVDGGVKITAYLGTDTVVNIPDTIDGKKVVMISGSSKTAHYGFDNKNVTDIKIPDSVTEIVKLNCGNTLESIVLPNGLKKIGDDTFYECSTLKSIEIPNTVTEIGEKAFYKSGLESLTLPDSVKVFCGDMIAGCTNLKEVRLPKDIRVAEASFSSGRGTSYTMSFYLDGCTSLTNTDFLKNVKPSDTANDSRFAVSFVGCEGLTSVTFPEGIEEVGAISGCDNLTEITLPNSVTTFGGAPLSSFLKKITLSDNLKSLEAGAFLGCSPDLEIVYKGKTYKPNQEPNLIKAINGN
ncbi:MAG: leucine-rich repeat domain-containing protein [Oscillospiraceae bacterium]|nr:leucine-rich repeat domain-containing protein [Oscillospiraceae bacterium]